MKKIAIIGGGLAGLTAGIYGQKAGFETTIYEKNHYPGGCCCSWQRGSYVIDNCIHWLMGTKDGTSTNTNWKALSGLKDDTVIYKRESFYVSELDGEKITLWRDLNRTQEELLALSPDDEKEIRLFIEGVELGIALMNKTENDLQLKDTLEEINDAMTAPEVFKLLMFYKGLTLSSLAERFRHPLLKSMILDFSAAKYEALWLIISYSMFVSGCADVPVGGSGEFTKNIAAHYEELGGKIEYGKEAVKIETEEISAFPLSSGIGTAVVFKDGSRIEADYIVCACPLRYTFDTLLDSAYAPNNYERLLNGKKTPVYSSFQCAFSVEGTFDEVNDLLYFPCDVFDIACQVVDRIGVKNYRKYGDYIAPSGETVIQCSFIQYEEDYDLWDKLYADKKQYNLKKKYICDAILNRIEKRFPEYAGKIHLLDSWTPITYRRYLNTDRGLYMRYITTPLRKEAFMSCEIKGLKNVFLAGHTLLYPGGVPSASISGSDVIKKIQSVSGKEE